MMSKMILVFVGLLGLASLASAQIVQVGQCAGLNSMTGFTLASFVGTWYEVGKSSNQNPACSSLQFATTAAGAITVNNPIVVNNFLQTTTGTATLATGTSQFTITLGANNPFEFWVLNTDYTNYAIAFNCVNQGTSQRIINVWQLGKAANSFETPATLQAANAALQQLGLTVTDLTPVDHSTTTCTQLPVIGPGQAVVLPGQCNNAAIPVVQNFQVGQFMDTWYEISSYYSANAVGTCAKAEYSLSGTTVNVVNSQVLNQRLDTITGTATLIGNDGSARLNVILNVQGTPVQQELLIIDTNYNGYAVSYSCFNLPNNERQVNSWILSRTPQISAASQAEVTRVINSLVDLNTAYYQTTDQSDDACFYYPFFVEGQPVIFPGQCDPNIPVQQDFDPTRYVDLWHDVQSYPSTFQQGTCNNAFYTLTQQGTVDVFNTQVINQRLDTMTGEATIPDPSQPAKLLVSFPVAGTDQRTSTNYWVLATNYVSYSLVYTCENLPNNQRAVFSWKLGRSKTISAADNAIMDAIIATIPVLDEQYYAPRDQSEAGCFYFPTPAPGVPVVFPGTCDDTIATHPNFDLAEFVGTWHEVEAYPKEFQTGTCVNHVFSASNTANTLNLVSNQVINQGVASNSGQVVTVNGGRLQLTMTVNGEVITIPYWVIATDYNNYALVYSCMRINDDFRSVHSWKLSRTQSLTTASITSINNAMAAVQVLNNDYFEPVDQSATGCFAYPTIPAGDPIVLQGQCGTVNPVSNFVPSSFAGTWYEISRYPSERQSGGCAATQFASPAQNTITLTQTIIYNERLTVVTGTATVPAGGNGVLTVTFSDGAGVSFQSTIYVLDVEYNDFAVLYSCQNLPNSNNRQVYSWKLSRTQTGLSNAANTRIAQLVANNIDLNEDYFQTTGQTSNDCFYYPDFEEIPDAIVLPGSCPPVAGQPNFVPADYLGPWYDVASYPIESQNGTCSRAEYTLVDGVITIRNTMVVNEELRTQMGIARLTATGAGVLQVTFVLENGEEVVSMYYILATDYTSYSLVYSCRDLPDGNRQVFSWKLSRTPTLTAAANTAINAVIASTQGLLQEYYVPTSQSEEDCFYVPEYQPGQAVLFRGTCEQIGGTQFNANQYLGWWHELERYPVDEEVGECSSANFVQSNNAFQVIETSVAGGVANETTSAAVLGADGSITITRNGVATTWHVLSTDYSSYSLLYSCENVATIWGNYRRVWSAKHSKARELTAAAETTINNYIANSQLLHQHLYETVNQSDTACFHYREATGEQVILPGQCDTQIPVQSNFDATRFAGTWYQMQRYPYPQVSNDGTCVGTRYTANGDEFRVLNWEVLDGTLNTIEGTATVNAATATFTVTLPVEDSDATTTMALRILATDYDDYALAYTCVNVNQFQRAIGAFKLSRSRSLSNEAQLAINTYMNTREELHQPYFISIAHNSDCDEPSSAFILQSSIIILLVCSFLQFFM